MKIFNALQLSILTATGPMLLALLGKATFDYSRPLFWVGMIGYVALFIWNVVAFADHLKD